MKIELAPGADWLESSLTETIESVVGKVTYRYEDLIGNPRDFYIRHATCTATSADGSTVTVIMLQSLRGEGDAETYAGVRDISVDGLSAVDIVAKLTPALEAARIDTPRRRFRIDTVETPGNIQEPVFLNALVSVLGPVKRDYGEAYGNPRDFFDRDAMYTARHDDLTVVIVMLGQNMWSPNDDGAFCRLRTIDIRGPLPLKNRALADKLRTALTSLGVATAPPVEELAPPLPPPPTPTPPPPPTVDPVAPDVAVLASHRAPRTVGDASFLAWDQRIVDGDIIEVQIDAEKWSAHADELFEVAPKLRAVHLTGLIGRDRSQMAGMLERLRTALASPYLSRIISLAITKVGAVYREDMWEMVETHSWGEEATKLLLASKVEHLEHVRIGWELSAHDQAAITKRFGCAILKSGDTGGPEWFY